MKYIFILILSLSSILCLSQTTIKYNVIGGGNIFMISNKDNKRIIFDIPQFKDTLSNFREVPLNDYNPYFIKQEFTCSNNKNIKFKLYMAEIDGSKCFIVLNNYISITVNYQSTK